MLIDETKSNALKRSAFHDLSSRHSSDIWFERLTDDQRGREKETETQKEGETEREWAIGRRNINSCPALMANRKQTIEHENKRKQYVSRATC